MWPHLNPREAVKVQKVAGVKEFLSCYYVSLKCTNKKYF